jgi:hypothetical protein
MRGVPDARTWYTVGALLAALLPLSTVEGVAQLPAGQASAGDVATERFLGSWELVEWVSTDQRGQTTHPFGESAQGQISYTADGRMSAHLMRPPSDPADTPPQHLAYWGRFTVSSAAATVTHHVMGADRPNWIGSDQVRQFRFEGPDRLILFLGQQHLTWRRAG